MEHHNENHLEHHNGNHLMSISALYDIWLPSYNVFVGIPPPRFCDISLIVKVLSIFKKQVSQIVSVS